jgi:Protein of unknown function (DUF1761)
MVVVSWLGIFLAAVSAMIIGAVWYSPALFGKAWMHAIGLSEAEMKKRMPSAMGSLVVVSLVTAYVLDHFINYAHLFTSASWLDSGLSTAVWIWFGFGLTTIVAHGAFEPRDRKVLLINAGNRLVTLLVMGAILGFFLGQ